MIILRCNKCEKEAMWSLNLAGRLPDDWLAFEGRDLCPDCAKKFKVFQFDLDLLIKDRTKKYFS